MGVVAGIVGEITHTNAVVGVRGTEKDLNDESIDGKDYWDIDGENYWGV
ncbi:10968_t:CDS:2 [Gigaspora rosea]|nr:10968_t:CDS:2 [Gigaspora rosea]